MVATVASIAAQAFTAAAQAVSGVIKDASLAYDTQGAYNTATGAHAITTTTITGGRGLIQTSAALKNRFPDYVAGPDDVMILLEGFSVVPKKNWRVTVGGVERKILLVGDIVGAGELFDVVAA